MYNNINYQKIKFKQKKQKMKIKNFKKNLKKLIKNNKIYKIKINNK